MTEQPPKIQKDSYFNQEISWLAFWALAVVFSLLAIVVGILLGPGFLNVSPFLFVFLCTFGWLAVRYKKRNDWRAKTKAVADFVWNAWSLFGVLVVFYFLTQIQGATPEEAAAQTVSGVLSSFGPLWLAIIFAPVYGTACIRCFLALEDVFKKETKPAVS